MKSAEQLKKYKSILRKLQKDFPKGETNWMGFTINLCYGGNKEPDIERLSLGGVASEVSLGDEFLKILIRSAEDNISFWQKAVLRDIQELEKALKD